MNLGQEKTNAIQELKFEGGTGMATVIAAVGGNEGAPPMTLGGSDPVSRASPVSESLATRIKDQFLGGGGSSARKVFILIALFFVGGFLAFDTFMGEGDFDFTSLVEGILGGDSQEGQFSVGTSSATGGGNNSSNDLSIDGSELENNSAEGLEEIDVEEDFATNAEPDLKNIKDSYAALPNELKPHPKPMGDLMSLEDEERFRQALEHEYVYQHFKAIKEVRDRRLKGSESILQLGLEAEKFWTRMEAMIALAEFGLEPSTKTLNKVIAGERDDLIVHYIRRMGSKLSPGTLNVLRYLVKIGSLKVKKEGLEVLAKSSSSLHHLYFAAASLDSTPGMKEWLQKKGYMANVPLDAVRRYKRLLANYKSAPSDTGDDDLTSLLALDGAKEDPREVDIGDLSTLEFEYFDSQEEETVVKKVDKEAIQDDGFDEFEQFLQQAEQPEGNNE